jgi:hypothetical protein
MKLTSPVLALLENIKLATVDDGNFNMMFFSSD